VCTKGQQGRLGAIGRISRAGEWVLAIGAASSRWSGPHLGAEDAQLTVRPESAGDRQASKGQRLLGRCSSVVGPNRRKPLGHQGNQPPLTRRVRRGVRALLRLLSSDHHRVSKRTGGRRAGDATASTFLGQFARRLPYAQAVLLQAGLAPQRHRQHRFGLAFR